MANIKYLTLGAIYRDRPEELKTLIRNSLDKAVQDVGIECAMKALSSSQDEVSHRLAA